jgi:hypothetical protein
MKRLSTREVLDRLPFEPHHSSVDTAVGPVAVRAFQIVVWLSFRLEGILSRPFPAVLDTGHSHNFSINEALLESWLNLRIDQFRPRALTKVDGEKLPLRTAELVLHRNLPTTKAIGRGSQSLKALLFTRRQSHTLGCRFLGLRLWSTPGCGLPSTAGS